MTTLPTGIPRLDALVHATATRYAQELQARCQYPFAVLNPHPAEWEGYIEDIGRLLRDLSRRESRDWAACALAGLVGVTVGATTPNWYWTDRRSDSTDQDGAPNGDGWPSGWWLMNNIGEACFFSGEPAEEWDPEMGHIVWIQGLPGRDENTAPALAQTLTTVCRSTP